MVDPLAATYRAANLFGTFGPALGEPLSLIQVNLSARLEIILASAATPCDPRIPEAEPHPENDVLVVDNASF